MKSWLHDNDIKHYSAHNKGKPVVAGRFIRILKKKIYKHITVISKKVYINNLDKTVDKYKNTYHRTIKIKHTDVRLGTYIEHGVENNDKDPKFKVAEHVRL